MPSLNYIIFAAVVAAVNAQSSAAPSMTPSSPLNAPSSTTMSKTTTAVGPGTTVLQILEVIPSDNPLSARLTPVSGAVGSIVDANAIATTIAVTCFPDVTDCVYEEPMTITQGPSTFSQHVITSASSMGNEASLTIDDNCQISDKVHVQCTNSVDFTIKAFGTSTATGTKITTTFDTAAVTYTPLTITGGVSKLHRPKATQTPAGGAGRAGIGGAAVAAVAGAVVGLL